MVCVPHSKARNGVMPAVLWAASCWRKPAGGAPGPPHYLMSGLGSTGLPGHSEHPKTPRRTRQLNPAQMPGYVDLVKQIFNSAAICLKSAGPGGTRPAHIRSWRGVVLQLRIKGGSGMGSVSSLGPTGPAHCVASTGVVVFKAVRKSIAPGQGLVSIQMWAGPRPSCIRLGRETGSARRKTRRRLVRAGHHSARAERMRLVLDPSDPHSAHRDLPRPGCPDGSASAP